jgi:hypothetical protein
MEETKLSPDKELKAERVVMYLALMMGMCQLQLEYVKETKKVDLMAIQDICYMSKRLESLDLTK